MCLFSAILPCPYVEIRDNRTVLVSVILSCRYAEIWDNPTGGQGRMTQTKHI
jgi:hypothetical protein